MKTFSQIHRFLPIVKTTLGICIPLLLLAGCGGLEQPEKPRFVIVLVDETDSFALHSSQGQITMFWPEVVPWVRRIVNQIQPGDKFCVIGIDEHGFDIDDVRIPLKTFNEATLQAIQEKTRISKAVQELTRRQEVYKGTDILGALYHTAHFLNREEGNYRNTIIIFSDMIQYPWPPRLQDADDLRFPIDTEVYCLYVNASGRKEFKNIVNTWVDIFSSAELKITDDHFYQRAETEDAFKKLFL
ncbi:MAG: hypothetical protein AB1422_07840 [bacterium]